MRYVTDGVRLFEIIARLLNYGIRGGEVVRMRECVTGETQELLDLDFLLYREVQAG